MTRREIEEEYDVEDGKITTPGIYKGQPLYIVFYHDLCLQNFYHSKNDKCFTIEVEKEDFKQFPEISKVKRYFAIFFREDGSIYIK